MIQSMTAYAKAETTTGRITVSTEIRSYNGKSLDLLLRLPHGYEGLEDFIRTRIGAALSRGRVEVRFRIQDESAQAIAFETDEARARAYHRALGRLKSSLDLKGDLRIDHLLACEGLFKPADVEKDLESIRPMISCCLDEALATLNDMRQKEGGFLRKDFEDRLAAIERSLQGIEQAASQLLPHYQEKLKERITVLTQGQIEIDPTRLAQEAAFLADRSDISEEIVRARSHLTQFRHLMDAEEPAGRPLNFLLQELNREFNTMGSKSGKVEISHTIVALKTELEKIREQVQNIE
ncbi:MAG: YicC/YloC family endoribonuclease [Thermodesulfobacteriota bacterium]